MFPERPESNEKLTEYPDLNEIDQKTVDELVYEIGQYKQRTAKNLIEIGNRLIIAKKLIPHGEWAKWLEEKVNFSQNTAGQFMRIAKEFSNSESIKNLTTSQLFLLLEIPQSNREEFIQHPHSLKSGEIKRIHEMTNAELKSVINEEKEAESKAKKAQINVEDLVVEVQSLNAQLTNQPPTQTIEGIEKLQAKFEQYQKELKHLKKTMSPEKNKQKIKKDVRFLNKKLEENIDKIKSDYALSEELDQETFQYIGSAEKACESAARELRSLITHR